MRSKNIWVVLTITIIWAAVVITSLNSPELMVGDEPVVIKPAAIANWFWGLLGTAFVLRSTFFRRQDEMGWGQTDAWPWIAVVGGAIWIVALLASLMAPDIVIGEIVTIPIAAIIAPPVAATLTFFACDFLVTGFAARQPLDTA